ncbi:MAG: efflux RND transporter periplasmic adaptor subunit [Alphaproteobacteria bacterium]|nr:efflux RND transporter periplasmic adaptor subunit [Alphaproteobacteria bacterium]
MFSNPFHRVVADSKGEREQLDGLLRITAPHERIALVCTGLLILAFSAWAGFGSIERYAIVDGLLIKAGERHNVVATEPGRLIEFLVAPGDHVEDGQPIARQNVPELERETSALRDRVNLLRTEFEQVTGGNDSVLRTLLATARVALLQMEAQRSARQLIVSRSEGQVMSLFSDPGEFLMAGNTVAQVRKPKQPLLQAVLRVNRSTAQHIQPGMEATVEFMTTDGRTGRLEGEVDQITTGPLPDWLARLNPAVPLARDRVDIVLRDPPTDFSLPDGTPCTVRVALGQHAPVALLTADHF